MSRPLLILFGIPTTLVGWILAASLSTPFTLLLFSVLSFCFALYFVVNALVEPLPRVVHLEVADDPLVLRKNQLLSQIRSIEFEIRRKRMTPDSAAQRISLLRDELRTLLVQIDTSRENRIEKAKRWLAQ